MIENGNYIEAILRTAIDIHTMMQFIFYNNQSNRTVEMKYDVSNYTFYQAIEQCKSINSNILTPDEFDAIDTLRRARNEVAHFMFLDERYLNANKCNSVLQPCFDIICKLHSHCISLQESNIGQDD